MDVEIALNELSIAVAPNKYVACKRLNLFCDLLAVVAHELGTSAPLLRTPRNLLSLALAPNFNVYNWLNDPTADKDRVTYFVSVGAGRPWFDDELSEDDRELSLTTEAKFANQISKGLLFAYKRNGLALSILSSGVWHTPFLGVAVDELDNNGNIENYTAQVKHSSNINNLRAHLPWLSKLGYLSIKDGNSLLRERVTVFPKIAFLGDTQHQVGLLGKNDGKLNSLIRGLISLQEYCNSWNGGAMDINGLRANGLCIRNESEATLQQFSSEREYSDPDGIKRIFRWHFDINPGAWRGYIDWDDQKREIWLTYIGPHLPTKKSH